jgi:hypothetical protein
MAARRSRYYPQGKSMTTDADDLERYRDAVQLDRTKGATAALLFRGLKKLRQLLEDAGDS